MTYRWGNNCPDCSAFTIDAGTGEIRADQTFDRETRPEYLLRVVAEDGAPSAITNDGEPNRGMC